MRCFVALLFLFVHVFGCKDDCDDDTSTIDDDTHSDDDNDVDDDNSSTDDDSGDDDSATYAENVDLQSSSAKFVGVIESGYFGTSVAHIDDINGDGADELLVGAPGGDHHPMTGVVYLFFTPLGGEITAEQAGQIVEGQHNQDTFGHSVSGIGDRDGDGSGDFLVGSPGNSENGLLSGAVFVFLGDSGVAHTDTSSAYSTLYGEDALSDAGWSLDTNGDYDLDAIDDLVIGAPGYDDGNGAVYLLMTVQEGESDLSIAEARIVGGATGGRFGHAIASAGDVDGDGYGDLLVGAPYHSDSAPFTGRVFVFYGPILGQQTDADADAILSSGGEGDQVGSALACAGDVDEDGLSDILVGAQTAGFQGIPGAGAACLVKSSSLGSTVLLELDDAIGGVDASSYLGNAMSSGDRNGDGRVDLLIAAYREDNKGFHDAGAAYLFLSPHSESPNLDTANARYASEDTQWAGRSVSMRGDYNSDGLDDITIGASREAQYSGAVYVFVD